MFFIAAVVGFILIPSYASAWGPMTHLYLANQIFSYASLLPAAILVLLKAYRQDFLYGNLMADMIIGKKYLPDNQSSHSWEVAFKLLDQAGTKAEKAFMYGYLCHLAADTVAHETIAMDMPDMDHTLAEARADSLINKTYWLQFVTMNRTVKRRNDRFLEGLLDSYIFSLRTNKRIYKGIVLLSLFNKKRRRGIDDINLKVLHDDSLLRMVDLLRKGRKSSVLVKNPL
jgi:hypothetical protein